jgi:2-haloacid dehalogenase
VVDVLRELVDAGVRTFALSNWSRRTYDIARHRFAFLGWFEGVVISGDEGVTKPDPAIYRALLDRYAIEPEDALFVDDRAANVEAATALGFRGVHLAPGTDLRASLRAFGLPVTAQPAGTA